MASLAGLPLPIVASVALLVTLLHILPYVFGCRFSRRGGDPARGVALGRAPLAADVADSLRRLDGDVVLLEPWAVWRKYPTGFIYRTGSYALVVRVDPTRPVDAEACDDDLFDPQALQAEYGNLCDADQGLRPNVRCEPDCSGFIPPEDTLQCCLVKGEVCPSNDTGYRCCREFTHPDEPACQTALEAGGAIREVCR